MFSDEKWPVEDPGSAFEDDANAKRGNLIESRCKTGRNLTEHFPE